MLNWIQSVGSPFLKRCSYSLYSDTMLNIGYILNETNTDVHMYTWRIYSRRTGRFFQADSHGGSVAADPFRSKFL